MDKNPISRLELKFWNFTIQALSQSIAARGKIEQFGRLIGHSEITSLGFMLGISGAVGLIAGYGLYYLAFIWR